LFVGTATDNMRDAAAKGRLSVPRPNRQKITDEQAVDIIVAFRAGARVTDLAVKYGVTKTCISTLANGKRRPWLRVPPMQQVG
jgi:hypothetical protein